MPGDPVLWLKRMNLFCVKESVMKPNPQATRALSRLAISSVVAYFRSVES